MPGSAPWTQRMLTHPPWKWFGRLKIDIPAQATLLPVGVIAVRQAKPGRSCDL